MITIARIMKSLRSRLMALGDLPPLAFRLTLAYGFYGPAMEKLKNLDGVIQWFGTLGIPFPTINAYMAVTTELAGVVLMTLGLASRLIAIPMMFVMLVAIMTVHLEHGFSCAHNGFEIPFYYLLMLFGVLIAGPGRISFDALIDKKLAQIQ